MNFDFLEEYGSYFLTGAVNTLVLALFTVLLGSLLGLVIALMKMAPTTFGTRVRASSPFMAFLKTLPIKILGFLASTWIEVIRGTPLLVQIFIIYYGLPLDIPKTIFLGVDLARFIPGIIALSINSSAYIAEIVRAGIQAVDKGQMEASRSLGFSTLQSMQMIILPQAVKNILPALGNEFVVVVKESSIVSVIGIAELLYNANIVRGATYRPMEPLLIAAAIYFVMTFLLSKGLGIAERRMRSGD